MKKHSLMNKTTLEVLKIRNKIGLQIMRFDECGDLIIAFHLKLSKRKINLLIAALSAINPDR